MLLKASIIWPGNMVYYPPPLLFKSNQVGEIYKINILGTDQYVVTTNELVNELCDEKRFQKSIMGSLVEARAGANDGLFTAYNHEHNWHLAHKILVPAFGPIGIQNTFDEMYDIGTQLVAKWARSTDRIDVSSDFTRLTLDSIALCAMDKRFNSFYSENMHPFVDAMVDFLVESGARETRTKLESILRPGKNRRYQRDINLMRTLSQDMVDQRRAHPSPKKDLLNAMILGADPTTGEKMTDKNIIDNMITFLIAGHETTSGMLSFATYHLLKNPEMLRKAQAEVDTVVGTGPVRLDHMSKLPYIEAILRETLRLSPTAPAFGLEVKGSEPQILGGKYLIPTGSPVYALLTVAHRDPEVYGPDANEFRPERMYGEAFNKLPSNAWKPFGNGARGCIGRGFAWQEAILAFALILQNFDLRLDDPSYQLRIKETLTIKPDGLFLRASLRKGIDPIKLEKKMFAGLESEEKSKPSKHARVDSLSGPKKPINVLYGSNSGTCEGLAHSFASNAVNYGYEATIKAMDTMVNHLPQEQPVVMITSSYEGQPPDNAVSFVEWIQTKSTDLRNVKYAVFGCGHHDWVSTYQKIPQVIDMELETRGATRIGPRGETDVALGKVFNDFDYWQDEVFWPHLGSGKKTNLQEALDIRISTTARASHLNYSVQEALVLSNKALTATDSKEKRHIELRLPTSLTYQAGDYLAVLPMNDKKLASRVMRHFGLPWDAVMTLESGSHSFIPTGTEIAVSSVLESYVELGTPATRKNLATITAFVSNTDTNDQISADNFVKGCATPSVLDILEAHPEVELPFSVFLSMLPPMRIRQYSISSSPLIDPNIATITFSLANSDSLHPGVATNYLKTLEPGSKIHVIVKTSHAAFHPPLDDKTPVIMACAGSGLAPFRGFVQERVAKIESGKTNLGPALLFIGCRSPTTDKLFAEELQRAENIGAVKLYYAYSRASDQSEGCKYVQDRIWRERAEVSELFDNNNARAYLCGSSAVGKGVTDVVLKMVEEEDGGRKSREEILGWWEGMRNERYAVDVFD